MTSRVLQLDLHDAERDGVYRVVPDDPATLVDDAVRAGLRLLRVDLRDCAGDEGLLRCLAQTFQLPSRADDWDALATGLRDLHWLPAPGYVLMLDHADVLRARAPAAYQSLRGHLRTVARDWHARGVPFFAFMTFPDSETLDAAIDA
ncbi:MAG: barstar family protein [Frateuria sp.]|uniref:barstar family protein n=1 Tax=Frateuria sp. TaxID=2211372 RepID=UPI00181F51A0|nr:barstar family protein [Frateuria sp.]NUO71402.1 barstar family protein [Frateuria sp.]NUR22768.1 barstar family protein [Frateuria sp.]